MCFVDFGCLIGPFGPNAMVYVANSFNSIQFYGGPHIIMTPVSIAHDRECSRHILGVSPGIHRPSYHNSSNSLMN